MRLIKQNDASRDDHFMCDECRTVPGELVEFHGSLDNMLAYSGRLCINCLGKAVELLAVNDSDDKLLSKVRATALAWSHYLPRNMDRGRARV